MNDEAAGRGLGAAGYVDDTSYPARFHRELAPTWLQYVAALGGAAPRDLAKPFAYLELGCGPGSSIVPNAAALPRGEFHACDVSARHIDAARTFAAQLEVRNLQLHTVEFGALPLESLPDFDFIVAHGVYSWVTPAARAALLRIVAAKLKPGGLFYVSYNCQPGWSVEQPLRRLLFELAQRHDGDAAQRAGAAREELRALGDARLRYFTERPSAGAALESYAAQPAEYLAHEFLNEAWEVFYSTDVSAELAPLGLRYVGSATLADNHAALIAPTDALRAIAALPTEPLRQLAMDFAANRRFRRDVFRRAAGTEEAPAAALDELVVGSLEPERLRARVRVPLGEIALQPDFIEALRARLLAGTWRFGELAAALARAEASAPTAGTLEHVARNLCYLLAAGALRPCLQRRKWPVEMGRTPVQSLRAVLATVAEDQRPRAVPSAILGSGVELTPAQAAALRAFLAGEEPSAATRQLVRCLTRLGLLLPAPA